MTLMIFYILLVIFGCSFALGVFMSAFFLIHYCVKNAICCQPNTNYNELANAVEMATFTSKKEEEAAILDEPVPIEV